VIIITAVLLNTQTFYPNDKTKAQLLRSWFKQWHLLEKGVIISFYRKRQLDTATYSSMDGDQLDCNNIQELTDELQLENTYEQWRLTIDSSNVSLKAVLLHNGNNFPAIPLAHARHMKVTYENLQVLLQKICYEEHQLNEYM
jgi:hypothetical protein